jgi:hypothetical protein
LDSFGGAVPVDLGNAMENSSGVTEKNMEAQIYVDIAGAGYSELTTPAGSAKQHQWNLNDTFDISHRTQHWKFGVDFRQISTYQASHPFVIYGEYASVQSILTNSADSAEYENFLPSTPVYNEAS